MAAKKRKRKWNVQVGDASLDQGVDVPMERTAPYGTMPAAHAMPWGVQIGQAQLEPTVTVELGEPEFYQDGVRAVLGEPVITDVGEAPKKRPKKKAKR